jgi:TPR repeat protein
MEKRLRRLILGLLLPCALLSSAIAGPRQDGEDAAYAHGDYATALRLLRPPANQGDASAQFYLGAMYDTGQGVPQNYAGAVKWYRKAAEQGNALAQLNLAIMYYSGRGAPQDYVRAYKWANLAAARIPASETQYRAMAVKLRDEVAEKMTPEKIAEAQRLASQWTPK